jgi:PKD repeat protein
MVWSIGGVALLLLLLGVQSGCMADTSSGDGLSLQSGMSLLPLAFMENRGQTEPVVLFHGEAIGHHIFFTRREVVLVATGREMVEESVTPAGGSSPVVVRMGVAGARPGTRVEGIYPQEGTANFLIGNDPAKWKTHVPVFGGVAYRDVLPGTDLVYQGKEGYLKREVILSAGADPTGVVFTYRGVSRITIQEDGTLDLETPRGVLHEAAPVSYQELGGEKVLVSCQYTLLGDRRVRVTVGDYDPAYPLVIDPVLDYSTFLGGNADETGYGIAVDDTGCAYITGTTESTNFPRKASFDWTKNGWADIFVTKLTSDGTDLVYSTYIGGSRDDIGYDIAVDDAYQAHLTGSTSSPDFPLVSPLIEDQVCSQADAFVLSLSEDGSEIRYSTLLGGTLTDVGRGIALDPDDDYNPVVTGYTYSSDFPVENPYQDGTHCSEGARSTLGADAFITKLIFDGASTTLAYSTYLGGCDDDKAFAVALDSSGNPLVTGYTRSWNFPVEAPFWGARIGGTDAFISQIDGADPSQLLFSTYLGGDSDDEAHAICVIDDTAVVSGVTSSRNFPVESPLQSTLGGGSDAFLSVLDPADGSLLFSTYLGGEKDDSADGVAAGPEGEMSLAGFTRSPNFPLKGAFQGSLGGGQDAFIATFGEDPDLLTPTLQFSSFLGGTANWDAARDLATELSGTDSEGLYLTGYTKSSDFPTVPEGGALQSEKASWQDAFVAKVVSAPPEAAFSADPEYGPAPLTVVFFDESTGGPDEWSWDFGDGGTSLEQDPEYTFDDPGIYNVTLTVFSSDGTSTYEGIIEVGDLPSADFQSNVTIGAAPLSVAFEDLSTGDPFSWSWDFGDGETSDEQDPVHTFSSGGTYEVVLEVCNDYGCDSADPVTISVGGPPVAAFNISQMSGTAPLTVDLTDQSLGSPTSWNWSFGDGGTSTAQDTSHTFSLPGTYDVNLTVANAYGSSTAPSVTVSVGQPPVANFTADPLSGTVPLVVNFTDHSTGSPTSWNWNFGDGTTGSGNNPLHTYLYSGNYSVNLTASNAYGSSSLLRTRYVNLYGGVGSSALLSFTPSTATVSPGSDLSVALTLNRTALGLNGYNVTVGIGNGTVAFISAATGPLWAASSAISGVPSTVVSIAAVDTGGVVTPGTEDVSLGSVVVRGNQTGTTTITITAVSRLEDDFSNPMTLTCTDASVTVATILPLPGYSSPPNDLDGDGKYEDLNGDGKFTYQDVAAFFSTFEWIIAHEPPSPFDFNDNGRIDYGDIIALFHALP